MKISEEQVSKFQLVYEKHFGENISKEEALTKGIRIVRLVEIILKEKAKLLSEEN
jgi:hypothetical protein